MVNEEGLFIIIDIVIIFIRIIDGKAVKFILFFTYNQYYINIITLFIRNYFTINFIILLFFYLL